MSGKNLYFLRNLFFVLFAAGTSLVPAQDLIAVLDIVSDGSVPAANCSTISDSISAIIAQDTSYMQFDRTMLPDLLGQLTVREAATSCSDPQCLMLIGNMIGANLVVGGFIRYSNKLTEIELNLVSIAEKRALNTVSMSTGSKKAVIMSTELPALIKNLFDPNAPLPPTKLIAEKGSIFSNPALYIGTLVAGVVGAGAYYYSNYYKAGDGTTTTPGPGKVDKPDVPEEDPSLYGDFPARGE